jgi:hypothetical protein
MEKRLKKSLCDSKPAYPNFGTVVWFEKSSGFSNITIGDWLIRHRKFKVFIAYGVTAYWSEINNNISELIHGNVLAIQSPENVCRYYPCPTIYDEYDKLLMPLRAVLDWDGNKQSKCLHFNNLYWFYPDYRNPVSAYKKMGKVELIDAITKQVEQATHNTLLLNKTSLITKSPQIPKSPDKKTTNTAQVKVQEYLNKLKLIT